MKQNFSLTVIVPAYNEEDNLETTVTSLIDVLCEKSMDWEIILIDDGSIDSTGEIMRNMAQKQPGIKAIYHKRNRGIGSCFCHGVEKAGKESITWIPADGENELEDLIKYLPLLEHVDIIVPFVANVNVRSWVRCFLSKIYLWIVNLSFGTMFNYTNGTIVYRRRVFKFIKPQANSFFVHAECLIKAVRGGFLFAEVPVYLKKRKKGRSKALTIKSFYSVIQGYIKLFLAIHINKRYAKKSKHV